MFQVSGLTLPTDPHAQPVRALVPPSVLVGGRQVRPPQLPGPMPFQVQDRYQGQLQPPVDRLEPAEPVLVEAERAFQFFEKQLDVRPGMVVVQEIVGPEAKVVEHLLEYPPMAPVVLLFKKMNPVPPHSATASMLSRLL